MMGPVEATNLLCVPGVLHLHLRFGQRALHAGLNIRWVNWSSDNNNSLAYKMTSKRRVQQPLPFGAEEPCSSLQAGGEPIFKGMLSNFCLLSLHITSVLQEENRVF